MRLALDDAAIRFEWKEKIMWYAVTWLVVAGLLLTWTLLAWLADAVVGWVAGLSPAQLADVGQGASEVAQQVGQFPVPEWLGVWWPAGAAEAWSATVAAVLPWAQAAVEHLPGVVGWLSPVVWVLWGLGAVLLLLLGGGASTALHYLTKSAKPQAVA